MLGVNQLIGFGSGVAAAASNASSEEANWETTVGDPQDFTFTGGDIIHAALPKYLASIDNPDVPFTLLEQNSRRVYVAQSGLTGRQGTDIKARPIYQVSRNQFEMADGDGRSLLNLIEQIFNWGAEMLNKSQLSSRLSKRAAQYDKNGDAHFNIISALHKSVRGSDPDAALYWLARMLEGGEDPRYIARRITRMAIEDIGLADMRAQDVCLQAWQTYERLGSPEGDLALAQAVLYLALAPKSNASYKAYKNALISAKKTGSKMPPKHILNAPTKLMKDMAYGNDYLYDHDQEDGFSGQNYFPDDMPRGIYYLPVERGEERELKKRIEFFSKLRVNKNKSTK